MLLATICFVVLAAAVTGHLVGDVDHRRHKAPMLFLAVCIILALIFVGPNLVYFLLSLLAFYF